MRKWISCGVAVAMLITSFAGVNFVDNSNKSQAANNGEVVYELDGNGLYGKVVFHIDSEKTSQTNISLTSEKNSLPIDEFYDEEQEAFGSVMNTQMTNYLNDNSGAAVVEKMEDDDLLSKVTFSMKEANITYTEEPTQSDADMIMAWLYRALAKYPNLCTLLTSIDCYFECSRTGVLYLDTLVVHSPVSVSEIKSAVNRYNYFLERLVKVPKEDATMTEAEKLLYIHDEIVAMTQYVDNGSARDHIPMAAAIYGEAVCQSYAAILNQAAESLGIEILYITSDTHAWNAVKLDEEWYYIDTTWDDPVGEYVDRNYVGHTYFLVQEDDFSFHHQMDDECLASYGSLLDNMGNAYDNYFPKENYITSQMCYADGNWYYTKNNTLYTWDGVADAGQEFADIPTDADRECAVFDGTLYYSGSDGVYQYQEEGEDICLSSVPAKGLNMADGILYYLTDSGDWTSIQIREPDPTPTPTPTASPTPSPTPTAEPTEEPTPAPTAIVTPTVEPTESPTMAPTKVPSANPTMEPTIAPTPTAEPTVAPTKVPSANPTMEPTVAPTSTAEPTEEPTLTPEPTRTEGDGPTLPPTPTIEPIENSGENQSERVETDNTIPAKTKITSVKNRKKKAMQVKWKKISGAFGYQIRYATNKKLKNSKKRTTKKCKIIIKKLKKKKTYYVKVRAYKWVNGKKIYGKWSKVKKVKIKK